YWMGWIRQKPGQGLEWIGYIDGGTGTTFAQSLQGQFSITKDTNKNMLYLEVKSLKAEDTARLRYNTCDQQRAAWVYSESGCAGELSYPEFPGLINLDCLHLPGRIIKASVRRIPLYRGRGFSGPCAPRRVTVTQQPKFEPVYVQ
ncbi:hypothetical protein QTP86_018072, partial [Hemibagrus guttatus]